MNKNLFFFSLMLVALFAINTFSEEEQTYAERLGWEKGNRVVIFHIDDAGLCYGANHAVFETFTKGVATSCSIMMPCAWVDQFVKEWKKNPHWDAGLHLTLTSE
ncbi:MAG: ChbG/HpnK family deacetylase, partial [Candidatus Hydrogenedens sp.]